jgi:uncharacterized repeat protein (TIGR03803 family)
MAENPGQAWPSEAKEILMTTLRTFAPFTLWPTQGQKGAFMKQCRWACAILVLCAAAAIASPAQTLTTLASFTGTNGSQPYLANLVQATNGNFYGTTQFGGPNKGTGCVPNCGTVFEITPAGKLTTLYDFCAHTNCTDGSVPNSGLVQASNGLLYGTTNLGGANGFGTIFEMTLAGKLTTIYNFCSVTACTDGARPGAALIQATNGKLYSTTSEGGTSFLGTVYEITLAGKLTTLHSFDGTDGELVNGALVQGTNGNFYGTATLGGTSTACSGGGCGTVFKMTPGGTLTTLHSFDGTDGEYLYAGLVQTTNGNFYGVTYLGGTSKYGTVFEITPAGSLTTWQNLDFTDGGEPLGALVQATDGNLYGTTSAGGAIGAGTIFEMTPAGTLTTLYSFCSLSQCTDGKIPEAGLIQGTNGDFYGTTIAGGAGGTQGDGTVFSFATGLHPFVETQPTAGKVGGKVIILGNNLNGATSVTFNTSKAAFNVVSNSEITTTVPEGATTGKVKVVTPKRKLTSNVNFRVLK